jgi:hypothetical protein
MVSKFIRFIAFFCCGVLIVSFVMFAINETNGGEAQAQLEMQGINHPVMPPQPKSEGQPRKTIDKIADELETPFKGIVTGDDKWANRLVPLVLALLVFGLGLGFLARTVEAHE